MPKEYTAIRDSLVAKGTPYDKAQSIAAGAYNKRHPGQPLSNKPDTGHGPLSPPAPKKKRRKKFVSHQPRI